MKFTTITLGCKVNLYETESLTSYLEDKGWEYSNENADVCIINTCTVTSKAEQKARRIIRLLLEKFPKACVVVTGCYAEVEASTIEKIDSRIAVLKGTAKDAV